MKIKVINNSRHKLPEYKTEGASGLDLQANLESENLFIIRPLERKLIPTGISLEIPQGYEAQVRPRSGLSLKVGLTAILGTIDSDYRGEIGVIAVNLSNENIIVKDGERVAQLVFQKVETVQLENTTQLSFTERGDNGFGSTGK